MVADDPATAKVDEDKTCFSSWQNKPSDMSRWKPQTPGGASEYGVVSAPDVQPQRTRGRSRGRHQLGWSSKAIQVPIEDARQTETAMRTMTRQSGDAGQRCAGVRVTAQR